VLVGQLASTAITLSGTVTQNPDDEGLTIDVVGAREHWRAHFHDAGPARPTEVTRFDGEGTHTLRPRYESAHRATWHALYDAVASGGRPAHALSDFAADIQLWAHAVSVTKQVS
jgi:hypothetical protein